VEWTVANQAWGILPKIIEIAARLRQDSQLNKRLHEVHPEICFYFLAGQRVLQYNKKNPLGHAERYRLLEPFFGQRLADALAERHMLGSARDDVLDAFAALWTAERIFLGMSQTIPSVPPKDSFGLNMEMVF
jgi:predicted RNase H-like nuclease